MSDKMNDGLKKVAYTGIGLAAMSADMLGKAVETLAARGEEAVQKGKVMNEELRRRRSAAKEDVKDIADALEKMTKEEIDTIRAKLEEIRMNWIDKSDEGAES